MPLAPVGKWQEIQSTEEHVETYREYSISKMQTWEASQVKGLKHINDKKKKGMDGGLVDEKRLKSYQVFFFF